MSPAEHRPTCNDAVDDLALVRRARLNDPEAIEALLEELRCVRRILVVKNGQLRRPLDPTDLEDAIQDTLVSVWRRLGDFEGRGTLQAWAYRFCHYGLLEALRRRRRNGEGEEANFEGRADPGEEERDPDDREQVYRALDRIGSPDADVIRWKHLDGLTFPEIARRTGDSLNTVKSRYYRGLTKVRSALGVIEDDVGGEGV